MAIAILHIHLFGKLWIEFNGMILKGLDSRKVQELFCYLLLNRNREHSREVLANLLWCENTTAQSKSYLRKVLWQLQYALESQTSLSASTILLVDSDWIQINVKADMWLDVEVFEQAYTPVMGIPGEKIDDTQAQNLRSAVKLYRADLVEDCYQSWCLYERQRLQLIYLSMLDKLMGYSEVQQEYESGIGYGMQILQYDRAHESTYRRLMRLLFLSGDRTGALRQFERCVTALHEELGVHPTECTTALYDQIRRNQLIDQASEPATMGEALQLPEVLGHLRQLESFLMDIHHQVQQDIRVVEKAMKKQAT
ncbi:MAG TPA: BTAD domain-containing putative transcriptional regulator [Ktedonobacteraceae bacterium]|nr:BTAD domain-containing putative transcriptional regulator [Ktedonobacteraceae bacterium]